MRNPFKEFRNRYKSAVKPIKNKETQEQEARRLALQLDAIFVQAPMFKPYNGDFSKIQLDEICIQYFKEILNTSNKLIIENEFYQNIKGKLEELLEKNSKGLDIDSIVEISGEVKRLYYSMQPQEYWEEKDF